MRHLSLIAALFTAILLTACGDKKYEESATAIKPEGRIIGTALADTRAPEENPGMGDMEMLDSTGRNLLQDTTTDAYKQMYGRSTAPLYPVYFAFDSKKIGDDQLKNLNSSARHLKKKSAINIVIEGNTDSRGTDEYNMALGEYRALAVKKYLEDKGISADRITTNSYGFHRPLFHGENETSWAKNRRADLVIVK